MGLSSFGGLFGNVSGKEQPQAGKRRHRTKREGIGGPALAPKSLKRSLRSRGALRVSASRSADPGGPVDSKHPPIERLNPGVPGAFPSWPDLAEQALNKDWVQLLNEHGAINWRYSPNFTYELNGTLAGRTLRQAVESPKKSGGFFRKKVLRRPARTSKESDDPINPIFRRKQWNQISDSDYELLKPALRLASCLLDDTRIMPFFHGLLHKPRTQLWQDPNHKKDELGEPLYTFRPKYPQDNEEMLQTYKAIVDMRPYVTFDFDPAYCRGNWGAGAFGDRSEPGRPGVFHLVAKVSLAPKFMDVYRGDIKASSILLPSELGEPLDEDAAMLRTNFFFAVNILHELTHVIGHMYYLIEPDDTVKVIEPFFGDQRVSELGHAFEQFVFGGIIRPIKGRESGPHVDCAYGLHTRRWPGLYRAHYAAAELAPPRKYGIGSDIFFAMPMDSVAKFFTTDFWEYTERYGGGEAFHCRKDVRLAVRDMDKSRWDKRDSPTLRIVADEPPDGGVSPSLFPPLSVRPFKDPKKRLF